MTTPTTTALVSPKVTSAELKANTARRGARKTGNPQTDRDIRDAAAAADAAVLNGAGNEPSPPRTKKTSTAPAALKAAANGKALPKPAAPKPTTPKKAAAKPTAKADPKPAAPKAPKPDVRAEEQARTRKCVQAYADATEGFTAAQKQDAANRIHHLPTGKDESGARWWPTNLPRPQRSDWTR